MDQLSDLSTWKESLDQLESEEDLTSIEYGLIIEKLKNLFLHMAPQTAPRLQKELESCTRRSDEILGQLFDKIDLSDKQLLCSFLKCLHAFGYMRMTQVTYYIDQAIIEESNSIYSPAVEKVKWYDLEPLLPPAGTVGWKGIMTSYLVRDEQELYHTCLQLLCQKLHFYSIISHLDRYIVCESQIKRSGGRVAEKLFEQIRDVAYEDERMIGLDEFTYNILSPFIDEEQKTALIDAVVQDLFKPFLTQKPIADEEIEELYILIERCIMNETSSQDVFISKLLEHLKCNMVRMKRRHSVEAGPEDGDITWKTLIDDINNGDKLQSILAKVDQVHISSKSFQASYISNWLQVVSRVLLKKILAATNSLKIIGVCSFLVVKAISIPNESLSKELSETLARTIDSSTQIRLDKLFGSCSPSFLGELTKKVFADLESTTTSNVPLVDFYKSYLNRYLKCCTLRVAKLEPEDLESFVTVICEEGLCVDYMHSLQNICIQEISECIDSFKDRISNKIMEVYLKCTRMCGKTLYKFIKRNAFFKTDMRPETADDPESSDNNLNDSLVDNERRELAIGALICTVRIAIEGKDKTILDRYANLLLKLFKFVEYSFDDAVGAVLSGRNSSPGPLEPHLTKLTTIYIEHKELVSTYTQRDLLSNLSDIMMLSHTSRNNVNGLDSSAKVSRKSVYSQLKVKLENLESQALSSSIDVYQTIINKQYSVVTEQSLGSINDTIREDQSCTHGYRQRLQFIQEISAAIAEHSSPETLANLLNEAVSWLEQCDPLDHPRFLYILSLLQSLIPKNIPVSKTKGPTSDPFRDALPRISCALIRLCKSVELGPSIHAYKNSGSHKSNRGIQCCTYSSCIRIYTAIFRSYPPKAVNPYMTDAMQLCINANLIQYAAHSSKLHRFFSQLASAIADLLMSICIGRKEEEIVRCSMPIFLTVFSHLIRCIIMASDRQKLETMPKQNGCGDSNSLETHSTNDSPCTTVRDKYERKLELLAIDIGKCLNNMCNLRVKLVDHAPHLISAYIKDIQRASCPDHIKLHLNEGIFRIFNLVDAHQKGRQEKILEAGIQRKTTAGRASGSLFEMIHARLDQASREIFRDMHDNHNKFHRYVGKC